MPLKNNVQRTCACKGPEPSQTAEYDFGYEHVTRVDKCAVCGKVLSITQSMTEAFKNQLVAMLNRNF